MKIKTIIYTALIIVLSYGIFAGSFQYFHHIKPKNNPSGRDMTQPNTQNISPPTSIPMQDTSSILSKRDIASTINVPVLMYHYIRDFNDPNDQIGTNLSVSPKQFDNQLSWLKSHNYQTVDFKYLDKPYAISHKPIVLTFDDGYSDAYTNAFPILKKYNFTATFYIITNSVGKDRYMSWDQIREMQDNNMNIGSHTQNHPDLSKASLVKAENEISQSKNIIEEKIGNKISDFCYPSGKYNQNVIDLLKKYNYQTATTTKSGTYDSTKNNLFEVPRLRITNDTNFSKILSQ